MTPSPLHALAQKAVDDALKFLDTVVAEHETCVRDEEGDFEAAEFLDDSKRVRRSLLALKSEHATLARAVLEAQAALEKIANGAPETEPERYEGDNHGDSETSGWNSARWADAKIARDCLAKMSRIGAGTCDE